MALGALGKIPRKKPVRVPAASAAKMFSPDDGQTAALLSRYAVQFSKG